MRIKILSTLVLTGCLICSAALAEVTRIEVTEQRPWLDGKYELIRGIVHYAIDPKSPSGKGITDITLAPRNAQGAVEFSGPFLLLRPADPAKANGATLIEVANRGGSEMNYAFFIADKFDLMKTGDPAFRQSNIFDRGYTVAWVGWQGDLPADKFGLSVPTGTGQGPVRLIFDGDGKTSDIKLDDPGNHCAADAIQKGATVRTAITLTERAKPLNRKAFAFAHLDNGKWVPDACAFHFATPPANNSFVEITYQGAPAPVMGLGLAAVRDFADHLKGQGTSSVLNARPGDARQVLAYGYSQSARFLRDFLYRGFNADADGKQVFDGMIIAAAGSGRGSFDHRYAQPGDAGNSVLSFLTPVDLFPFSDTPSTDIDGKRTAGVLDMTRSQGVMPKIIETFSSTEYWARAGSLLTVSPDGKTELPLDPDSRLYYFPSTVHAPKFAGKPDQMAVIAPFHFNYNDDMTLASNALLADLTDWVRDGKAPPASAYPKLGDTLVLPADVKFPALTGITFPTALPPVWQLDFGPKYATDGIISHEPPKVGLRYPLRVPQVDGDGNEVGGWKGITALAPLGTYTAWSKPPPELAPFSFVAGLNGGLLPFAKTKAERIPANDPRLSIEERYGDRTGYETAVLKAIDTNIAGRMLLPEEREATRIYLMQIWDFVIDGKAPE